MLCKSCGRELRENEKFCTTCGYYNEDIENEMEDDDDPNLDFKNNISNKEDNNISIDDDFPNDEDESNNNINFIESQMKSEMKDFKLTKKEENKVFQSKIKNKVNIFQLFPKEKTYDNELEPYIESYIGEDYRLIKKDLFNIYALLFNWLYVLYRKLYITGIIGLLIILILIYINPLYSLIFLGLSMILLGILFNKYYQLITKIKVSKIVKEKEGEDPFYVKELCKKNGGVNISICLIIYGIFLIASIFIFVKTQFIKPKRSFYFKETSENQANCISITRQSYLSFKSKINNLDAEEATCRVVVGNPKQFRMIIKISNNNSDYYVYYLADGQYLNYINDTRDINVLEEKEKSLLLNETEKNSLTEKRNIIEEYNDIIKRSKNEDELIKKGKETSAKNNFIITKEEMMR